MALEIFGVVRVSFRTRAQLAEFLRLLAQHTVDPWLYVCRCPRWEVSVELTGGFPDPLKLFVLRERLRLAPHAQHWAPFVVIVPNDCFASEAERAAVERVHLPAITAAAAGRRTVSPEDLEALARALGIEGTLAGGACLVS